ncbi:MAG: heat-inducible transcriptional repressor HrcA [Christensenellales bacterium]|jgi:heat-inducible transcriptional repressor
MKLDERKFMILQAIIDDYIMTAAPVGSRTISKKSGVGFSPATIRNEMSDLEELGYLAQPHTSAGRIPSIKAYRLYVDELLRKETLSLEDSERIYKHLSRRTNQVEEVIRRAAIALSDLTKYTSVIVAPHIETLRIQRIQIVPVSEGTALMVVVTSAGIVKDAIVRVPGDLEAEHLFGISQMLTEQLHDLSVTEVRHRFAEMFRDLRENRRFLAGIMDVLENRLRERQPADMIVGGRANMLNYPEYANAEKARGLLAVLESREKLYPILQRGSGMEFTVRIGPENELPELSDCSVITATYRVDDETTGTMGIIGPVRMRYGRVLSALDCVGRMLSELLSGE